MRLFVCIYQIVLDYYQPLIFSSWYLFFVCTCKTIFIVEVESLLTALHQACWETFRSYTEGFGRGDGGGKRFVAGCGGREETGLDEDVVEGEEE